MHKMGSQSTFAQFEMLLVSETIIVLSIFLCFIPGNFAQLCDEINKNLELLRKNAAGLDVVLETLDPQLHSLGVLAIL